MIAAHAALYVVAFLVAWLLRFDFGFPEGQALTIIAGLALIVVLRTAAAMAFRLYGGVLKYAGVKDLLDIVKAMSVASVAFIVVSVLLNLKFPRSVIAIDWFLSIMLVGGLRFGLRLAREALVPAAAAGERRKRVVILGAGDAGEALVRDLQRTYRDRYEVVGFLDDNKSKHGLRIHDVPVLGSIMYLGDYVGRFGADEAIIAIPSATGKTMRAIFEVCKIAGVRFKTIPGVDQLIDGKVSVNQVRDVAIEDLLGREPVLLETDVLSAFLKGKTVMVTGAGGSIGSEMCRQILRYGPRKLLLVEQSEPNLFFIHKEIVTTCAGACCVPLIADVTDGTRMEHIFAAHQPEVIFHAAAHKHVPMMEWNPGEAIKNNVFGTRTMADLAHAHGALAFVMISTDKAVNPTSVMGASKRVAEMYVQALSRHSKTKFSAVRFGNVLGSVGSVVPIFQEQIARGGPVTVTHPDMRRYFMTIPESCQLVMQAGAMGAGGEIFALDMGEPVKIVDLARDLITLSGFTPDEDIQVKFTGLRPGEKLFEELGFDAEKMDKTRHPKIYTGKLQPHRLEEVSRWLAGLGWVMDAKGAAGQADEEAGPDEVRAALKAVVPEFAVDIEPRLPSAPPSPAPVFTLPHTPAPVRKEGDREDLPALRAGGNGEEKKEKDSVRVGETSPPPVNQAVQDSPLSPGERGAGGVRLESGGGGEVGSGEGRLVLERGTAVDTAALKASFDAVWEELVGLCKGSGLLAVAWNTMGVKPPDTRRAALVPECGDGQARKLGTLKRSVGINSLAFLEIQFSYDVEGKRAHEHARELTREITARLAGSALKINEQLMNGTR
ncbi:MAG TPA: nucleoside-diphosphate sugar epimerase/dehydratase [Myxococcota bacterium]|nr:nucleoside-diphosphate sugar epimerase/dehydratase [Myxococcota bacterium]HRY93149.1 nucleoside-diphosphate sugar epimerase/dehydratase [Myxococcota bacterium]